MDKTKDLIWILHRITSRNQILFFVQLFWGRGGCIRHGARRRRCSFLGGLPKRDDAHYDDVDLFVVSVLGTD